MKRWYILALAVALVSLSLSSGASAEANTRIGAGVHYWKTLDKIDLKNVDENGLSWIASFQYGSESLLKLQADLEIFPKRFAGMEHVSYAPCAFVLAGHAIYGGLGIGTYYSDGKFADKPFYVLRAGVDLELLPSIYLDINANYRWENWKKLNKVVKDIDTNTVTLGAAIRLAW